LSKKTGLGLTRLFLIGLLAGLASPALSMYVYLYTPSMISSERLDLEIFGLVPWVGCCFYYDRSPTILEPENKLTGEVRIFYQSSELPSDNSLPYFFLVSAGQFTLDNSRVGFRDHVYMSEFANVSKDFQERAITIHYVITNIVESAAHYFVVLPQEGQKVLLKRIAVQGTVEKLVPQKLLGIAVLMLSVISVAAFAIDRLRQRKKALNRRGSAEYRL
jgi:hypothetical protein